MTVEPTDDQLVVLAGNRRAGGRMAVIAMLLAVFCLGEDLYVVAALIPTIARELVEPVAAQSIAAGIDPRARGTIMAFNSSPFNLAAVFSPLLAGAVYEVGDFRLLGTWTAGLAVIAFLVAWCLLPRTAPSVAAAPVAVQAEDCVAEGAPV